MTEAAETRVAARETWAAMRENGYLILFLIAGTDFK